MTHGKPEQPNLPMVMGIRDLSRRAGVRLLSIIREVVRGGGKQESIARDLGISDALLSQSLNSQRTFHAEWIPALLRFDHERKLLKYLAWESGCRVEEVEPLTKEQKFDLLVAELKRGGADVSALEKRAYEAGNEDEEESAR